MKEKYRQLCEQEKTIPIFSQAWWLDSVAGDDWGVAIVEKGDDVLASLPYLIKKRWGKTFLSQPKLTQSLGPWIRDTGAKHSKRLSREKDLLESLAENLPPYLFYGQSWHFSRQNCLPLLWKGFKQTSYYTYRLQDISDHDLIWSGFQNNIRTDVRKASEREGVVIRQDCSIEEFFELNSMVFHRQNKKLPYDLNFIKKIDHAASNRNSKQIFIAEDASGRKHAAVYLVWDNNTAYYIMGGGDPELRKSGATSLCMWEAIKFASTKVNSFDFEGSMIEPVERFFRGFGAEQVPYNYITHSKSRLFNLFFALRNL